MSSSTKSQIGQILSGFLKDCDIAYPHDVQLDHAFRDACYADAIQRGFDLKILAKPLDVGIAIADTAYQSLGSYSTRIFIAVWTALLTHIDDAYETYSDGLDQFLDRFTRRLPQRYEVLDQVATMIDEIPQHWGIVSSNLITTSEIDYLTSTIIDRAIEGMEVGFSFWSNIKNILTSIEDSVSNGSRLPSIY